MKKRLGLGTLPPELFPRAEIQYRNSILDNCCFKNFLDGNIERNFTVEGCYYSKNANTVTDAGSKECQREETSSLQVRFFSPKHKRPFCKEM